MKERFSARNKCYAAGWELLCTSPTWGSRAVHLLAGSKAMHIADILKVKGNRVITVSPDSRVHNLAQRLRMERIGALVVSASGTTVDGIISERDIVLAMAEHGAEALVRTAADLMTKAVLTCSPADTIAQVAKIMTNRRVRHMPVLDGGRLVGIISVGDILKNRLDELEMEANIMRDYAVARH
jgi:CBS domain-containing protein